MISQRHRLGMLWSCTPRRIGHIPRMICTIRTCQLSSEMAELRQNMTAKPCACLIFPAPSRCGNSRSSRAKWLCGTGDNEFQWARFIKHEDGEGCKRCYPCVGAFRRVKDGHVTLQIAKGFKKTLLLRGQSVRSSMDTMSPENDRQSHQSNIGRPGQVTKAGLTALLVGHELKNSRALLGQCLSVLWHTDGARFRTIGMHCGR